MSSFRSEFIAAHVFSGLSCAIIALVVIFVMLVLYYLASRTDFYREHAGLAAVQTYPGGLFLPGLSYSVVR
jgi:uncharacterized membrane protein (DUF485 family)